MAAAQTYQSEFTGEQMDARFTAVATLTAALEELTTVVAGKYVKPADGIPSTDMTAAVQASLAKAESAVQSLADYYTKTEVDQLLAAINGMDYVDVSTLPTASASTMGKIYLVGPDASGYYSYYYTSYNGSAYSWVGPLGTTEISLANYATKTELGQLDQELNGSTTEVEQTTELYATESGYGISAIDGTKVSRSSWYASDFIPIPGGITIKFKSRQATSYGIAFYTSDSEASFISGVVGTGSEETVTVPATANYYRICDYQSGRDGYVKYTLSEDGLADRVDSLETTVAAIPGMQESIAQLASVPCFDSKVILEYGKKILGIGASFMRGDDTGAGLNNVWLSLLSRRLGVGYVNDATGGKNVMYHANRLFNGTILGSGTAPISEIGAVLIMHTHDKDVFTLPEPFASYTVAEYEANVLPFDTTEGDSPADVEYAKAYDYIIKKVKALYYADKQATEYAAGVQTYVGQYYFNPAQIVICTHWHDARGTFNGSVRKLCAKWGLPLVQFDKKIGFTKNKANPAYGYQESIQFTGNANGASPVETISGVVFGWHPMCGDQNIPIQRKLAAIAEDSFKYFLSYFDYRTSSYCTESGYGIESATGAKVERSSWYASDFIPVIGGATAKFLSREAENYGIAFYSSDSEDDYISGVHGTGAEQEITIPANATYFRYCDYGYSTRTGYLKYDI